MVKVKLALLFKLQSVRYRSAAHIYPPGHTTLRWSYCFIIYFRRRFDQQEKISVDQLRLKATTGSLAQVNISC